VHVRVERTRCLFTRALEPGDVLPLPMAHGEGRFTSAIPGHVEGLVAAGQAPLRYAMPDGAPAAAFPENPNGSGAAVAAVCNAAGNVLAIMPHPERAQDLLGMSRGIGGRWGERRDRALEAAAELDEPGPGLLLFRGLAAALEAA